MRGNFRSLNCIEIEGRFSNESAIKYNEMRNCTINFDEIKPLLFKLPSREIDLIQLYYHDGKNQKDIATIFGVTQGAVSSRLTRARERLKFLKDLPKIKEEEIEKVLSKYFDALELEIIKFMIKTTCQSRTAQLINKKFNLIDVKKRMTQVKVRHRFEKCLIQLELKVKEEPQLAKYCRLLRYIKDNLYKLHEVKLPHFDKGAYAVFSITV